MSKDKNNIFLEKELCCLNKLILSKNIQNIQNQFNCYKSLKICKNMMISFKIFIILT